MLYENCPKQYWLSKNKPELQKPISDDARKHIEQGDFTQWKKSVVENMMRRR